MYHRHGASIAIWHVVRSSTDGVDSGLPKCYSLSTGHL